MIVSLLAYAGLRPDAMMRDDWADLDGPVLRVHANKTGRSRAVDVLAPLADDLRGWRLQSGHRAG
jgi:hypothetical protein